MNKQENYKTCSPIEGHIYIYDHDGNTVVDTHNMVVKSGRKIVYDIFNKVLQNETSNITSPVFYITFAYTTDPIQTVTDSTLEEILTNNVEKYQININNTLGANDIIKLNDNDLSITLNTNITSENIKMFNQIYISYKIDNTETLFSRVVIDPIYLGESASYSLSYTLYF